MFEFFVLLFFVFLFLSLNTLFGINFGNSYCNVYLFSIKHIARFVTDYKGIKGIIFNKLFLSLALKQFLYWFSSSHFSP